MSDPATLEARVQAALRRARFVLLPDFFLDHFVPAGTLEEFTTAVRSIHERGGGNVVTSHQMVRPGGNATNTAYALARLGARVALVAQADPVGRHILETTLGPAGVDLSAVSSTPHGASTVALEFSAGRNVMLSDSGPVADYGPDQLDDRAWALVDGADAVAVTNWSQMRRAGTEVLAAVLPRARQRGAFTFLDTGDPVPRGNDAQALVKDARVLGSVNAWSMNASEALFFARSLGGGAPTNPEEAARRLVQTGVARVDLHTATVAVSRSRDSEARATCYEVRPKRVTSAGDVWNAGNLAATMADLDPEDRLWLANATAACYLECDAPVPPTLAEVGAWMRTRPRPAPPRTAKTPPTP